jgi:hypothetical protein
MRLPSHPMVALLPLLIVFVIAGCYQSKSSSIMVTLSPSVAQNVLAGQTLNIMASVTGTAGYSSNNGVTWSLSGPGKLVNETSTSVTYDAPPTVSLLQIATVTATSMADSAKSASLKINIGEVLTACGTGSESKLNGSYAFLLQGFNSNGYMAIAGQFTADGTGKITGGVEDTTTTVSTTGATPLQLNPAGSSYKLGPDGRGCLTLDTSNGATFFAFAVGSSNGTVFTKGTAIEFEFDSANDRAAGILRLQDPTAFSTSQFTGDYAFGASGVNSSAQRFAIAGVADLSSGSVTGGTADADDGGTVFSDQSLTPGSYSVDANTGRALLSFSVGLTTVDFAFYVVNSSEAIGLTTDALSAANPIAAGTAELQSGSFAASSLSGNIVLDDTALSPSGPITVLGLLTADGVSNISGPTFNNVAGTDNSPTFSGSYAVATNGRVTLAAGANPPVFYLFGTNQGFEVGTGPDSSFGRIEGQSAGPFSDASFNGAYFSGVEDPAANQAGMSTGEFAANGSTTSPTLTGTVDSSSFNGSLVGLGPGLPFSGSYSISSNGVGSLTLGLSNHAPATDQVIMISPSKLVFFENGNTHPVIFVLEQ